jgi:hypothetical protein
MFQVRFSKKIFYIMQVKVLSPHNFSQRGVSSWNILGICLKVKTRLPEKLSTRKLMEVLCSTSKTSEKQNGMLLNYLIGGFNT